jgi:hypothetical protein
VGCTVFTVLLFVVELPVQCHRFSFRDLSVVPFHTSFLEQLCALHIVCDKLKKHTIIFEDKTFVK